MISPFFLLGIGLLALSVFMLLVWIFSRLIDNSGIVDVAWALGFTLTAVIYLSLAPAVHSRQWFLISMVVISSLRLAWHLGLRFMRSYPKEDPRYSALKEKMGSHADGKMLLVFLWQGLVLAIMTAPLAVVISDPKSSLSVAQFLAIALWFIGIVGEAISDYQLSEFTRNPSNKGLTCQSGIWRYSRHPNYFFEWLCSVAFFVYVIDSPFGLWTIFCPLLLLHLLLNVTGVKPSEENSRKSRADYTDYAKHTSAFVPWFRRNKNDKW